MPDSPSRALALPFVRMWWDQCDHHPKLTKTALIGVTIGVLLAFFGLPPVDMHGPLHYLGIMAPTCGGTRALRLVFLGQFGASLVYNPLSLVLTIGAIAFLARHVHGQLTGRWLSFRVSRGWSTILFVAVAVIVLEINQQRHAALLMTTGEATGSLW